MLNYCAIKSHRQFEAVPNWPLQIQLQAKILYNVIVTSIYSKSNCACSTPSILPCVRACLTGEMPELKGMKLTSLCMHKVFALWYNCECLVGSVQTLQFHVAKWPTIKEGRPGCYHPLCRMSFKGLVLFYWWKLHQQHCLDAPAKFQLILSEKQFLKKAGLGVVTHCAGWVSKAWFY